MFGLFEKKETDKGSKELESRIRGLFWNLCNQQEKVNGNIISLVNMLYDNQTQETRDMVIQSLKNRLDTTPKLPYNDCKTF